MDNVILQPIQKKCPCGGIGRRSRLKICRSQEREGSIPFVGTGRRKFSPAFFINHQYKLSDEL